MTDNRKDLGDDQGTRIGRPTPDESKSTGAGSEAAEGIHGAEGDRRPEDKSALEGKSTGRGTDKDADRAGSEPQTSHDTEHRSGYGGAGGEPVNY